MKMKTGSRGVVVNVTNGGPGSGPRPGEGHGENVADHIYRKAPGGNPTESNDGGVKATSKQLYAARYALRDSGFQTTETPKEKFDRNTHEESRSATYKHSDGTTAKETTKGNGLGRFSHSIEFTPPAKK